MEWPAAVDEFGGECGGAYAEVQAPTGSPALEPLGAGTAPLNASDQVQVPPGRHAGQQGFVCVGHRADGAYLVNEASRRWASGHYALRFGRSPAVAAAAPGPEP